MGRWYFSKKTEAEDLLKIDVYWLKKNGYLHPYGWKSGGIQWTGGFLGNKSSVGIEVNSMLGSDERYLRLQYSLEQEGEKKNFDYKIPLTTTRCNYGGVRFWFVCSLSANGVYCGKRVGTLFKAGGYFGCRHCHNLTYQSRNETRSGKFYPLFHLIMGHKGIDDLEEKVKRRFYAGKPTRKQRRLEAIYQRMLPYAALLNKQKELL